MSKKKPTRRRSVRGGRSPKSDINTKDMDLHGRSMSPIRKTQLDVRPRPPSVVQIVVPVEVAMYLTDKLTLGTLIRIVEASPDLKKILDSQFWYKIYLENFGYTGEYYEIIRKKDNKDELVEMVIKRYQESRK